PPEGLAVLTGQGPHQGVGGGDEPVEVGDVVDQAEITGLGAAEPAAGGHGGDGGGGGELGLDEGGHAGGERHAEIDLRQAEVAPVGAHDPVVVGQGEHGPGAEGVAVDRGDGGHGQ